MTEIRRARSRKPQSVRRPCRWREKIGKQCYEEAEAAYANARNFLLIMLTIAAAASAWGSAGSSAGMIAQVLGDPDRRGHAAVQGVVEGKLQTRGNPELVSRDSDPSSKALTPRWTP